MTVDITGLADAGEAPLALVGGKARALGRLIQAGHKVPRGFVVGPDVDLDEADLVPWSEDLDVDAFAVRSSGAAEDGEEASLAGMYRSFLGVERRSLASAVIGVRESAPDGSSIPVLVQAMIDPVCAGVAFTADPVTGDRAKTIVTATRGLADALMSGSVAGDEWEVVSGRVEPIRQPEGVMSRRLVRRVAKVSADIAEEFGSPQDVEWAWDGQDLWVVQARPITSLPPDVDWTPPVPGIYHRSLRLGEWLPEPVTPLCESWLLTRMERQIHEYLRDLLGQVAPEPHHVVVNGWYFYSLNWLPAPGVALWRNLVSIVPRLPKNWRVAAGMFPQTIRFATSAFEDEWRNQILPEYRQATELAEERVDDLAPRESIALIDGLADLAGRYFGSIAVVAGSAYKWEAQLAQFWRRHLRDDLGVSHMVALQGFEQAEVTSQTPRLESLDWWRPASPPAYPPGDVERLRKQREETERRAIALLESSPRRLSRYLEYLEGAQRLMPIREEQISQLSLAWPVMRRSVLRIGESLVASNVIESKEDVFFLTRTEAVALLDDACDMRDEVAARRRERDAASRLVPPLFVGRIPLIVRYLFGMSSKIQGAEPSQSALVHGTPASAGRATGPVRVIRDASQFEKFEEGEILVAPLTAPAWTDLFSRAAAVVTDVGSALAHASIIAREYGIPAVVGCGDATSRLRDGQIVTVDGSTGNVEPGTG